MTLAAMTLTMALISLVPAIQSQRQLQSMIAG
jgi:hypothetical protein